MDASWKLASVVPAYNLSIWNLFYEDCAMPELQSGSLISLEEKTRIKILTAGHV
jgi:hypothetical protein